MKPLRIPLLRVRLLKFKWYNISLECDPMSGKVNWFPRSLGPYVFRYDCVC